MAFFDKDYIATMMNTGGHRPSPHVLLFSLVSDHKYNLFGLYEKHQPSKFKMQKAERRQN